MNTNESEDLLPTSSGEQIPSALKMEAADYSETLMLIY
jgi:hypothetical protein